MSSIFHSPLVNTIPTIMLFFDNHGVTYPAREQRSPGFAAEMEEQKTPADQESAAQALDEVELD